MYNLRLKEKILLFLLITIISSFFASLTNAFIRPPNPVMDYVPQNIGIYNTYYENFHEPDCRTCHESSLERHHGTEHALGGNCLFCHGIKLGIVPAERDCKVCHVDGGPLGDFGNPHHSSDLADSGQCNECHLHVVETNSVKPSEQKPTLVTPSPASCENCHWPSGSVPHEAAIYDGDTAKFHADWQSWIGTPKPTIYPDVIEDPQPIEANGPVASGILDARPYRPIEGTHHEIAGKVFPKCYNCHASSPASSPDWNPNNPYLIRFCENCHSIGKLHSIQEHVITNNIYTVNGLLNQTVTANEKCIACHGDYIQAIELPLIPTDIPVIDRLEPNFGPPGIIVNIIPASGQCWNEDPVNGLCSFGTKMKGDKVKIGQKHTDGKWYWEDAPIYSWSEHMIQIKVPSWIFQPGKTRIKIRKENVGTSAHKVFTVRENPTLCSLSPSVGNWNQLVNIGGAGFGVKREKVYKDGFGYSTYVELHIPTSKFRVTRYRKPDFWDPIKIPIRLRDLFDIDTGNPVPEQNLYTGCWNLVVITDYFKDDGDGKYNYGLAGLDTPTNPQNTGAGDELLFRAVSDPVCFTVTTDPYINSIVPNPAPYKNIAAIYGSNFGTTQGTSVVKIWNKRKTKFKIAKIKSWSNTKIKFVVPKFGTDPVKYPKKKWVQVEVLGTPESNDYKLTIIAPGT